MTEEFISKSPFPVTDIGSLRTFEYYRDLLDKKGIKPVNHAEIKDGDTTSLEHLLWMCNHCIPRIRDDGKGFSVDKYSRWLGYVQGCLICRKVTTVEIERNRTRPWLAM
jgi:hypothetical protein